MSTTNPPVIKNFKLTGIILIVLGVISLITPAVAGTAVVLVIGSLLLFGGFLYLFQSSQVGDSSGKMMHIILGILMILGGFGIISHPLFGLSFLTLMMAMFFLFEGTWKIVMSFSMRPAAGWGQVLFSGIISLLLGGLIWGEWPLSGLWAVGTLLGVDFLLTGFFLMNVGSLPGMSGQDQAESQAGESETPQE
ncbi:HdeD family acid-resistance protein [Gimesia panareensis]|uniref:Acid-resistance membrane protein n=1 Tax=Gimesia panareensis TaxID=2527978 RepID=A0A518A627_9PLAN|nr:HdeD family acid-resistance protein [Gimesia panareensis]QDU50197.1 acid-resistance membrane protein [Gimesia panareensis]QDV16505.1 acid-resistance membrane protein [Gimesia panareensis]